MNLLVFQTNINTDERIHRAACRLCKLRAICRWSIDLEACVLWVESESLIETDVIRQLTKAGLHCHALT